MTGFFSRFTMTAALSSAVVMAVAGCDSRGSPAPSASEAHTPATQVAAADPTLAYNPAITVYKNPT